MTGVSKRFLTWLDAGHTVQSIGLERLARLRSLQVACICISLISPIYVAQAIAQQQWISLSVMGVDFLLFPVCLWLARSGQVRRAGHLFVGALLVSVATAVWLTGGINNPGTAWFLIVPMSAGLVLGQRPVLFWSLATGAVVFSFWIAVELGVELSYPGTAESQWAFLLVDWTLLLASTSALFWAHGFAVHAMREDLNRANQALRTEVHERTDAERRAVDAASARTTFVATMSHEIRTPLNGVLGVTELLMDTPLNGEQQELVRTAHRSSSLLHSLLDDVLDFSKIDAGALELEQVPLNLTSLCDDVAQMWRTPVQERGLSLTFEAVGDGPEWVLGDPTRLRQVLGNLINNAMKFTETGGLRIQQRRDGNDSLISVSDTGIGIDPAVVDTIFDPFRQADSSTTRSYGGSGLGLAICNELAQAMGGKLSVKSTRGVGSTFTLRVALPAIEAPAPPEKLSADVAQLRGLRVLLTDDNPVNLMVTTRLLERLGVDVVTATDGLLCIKAWSEHRPDLILMDCQMPVCDGYEATRRLRQRGARVPILALTANSGAEQRLACLDSGMNAHLTKPIQSQQLQDELLRWMVIEPSLTSTLIETVDPALVAELDSAERAALELGANVWVPQEEVPTVD